MAKRIEFQLPSGFVIGENVGEGDEMDTLATIQIKKGGKACLVALDDYRMPGYDGTKKEKSEDKRSYADAAADNMEEDGGY